MNHKKNSEVSRNSESSVHQKLSFALELLKEGKFEDANIIFSDVLRYDYSNQIAETGVKCCKYWNSRINMMKSRETSYYMGKYLYDEWKKFQVFLRNQKNIQMKVINCVMYFIFGTALQYLEKEIQDNKIIDLSTLFLIGLFHKKLGDFDHAIYYFERIINNDRFNAPAFAQLADCYALIDEERKAKVLFREGFFICPSAIELDTLDSNLISNLIVRISEYKIPREELAYWIPVYGRVLNVFNIKRELAPVELGKLKQDVFHLEQDFFTLEAVDQKVKARLINYYLWLYDFYIVKENSDDIKIELEDKMKNLSLTIYNILKNSIIQE